MLKAFSPEQALQFFKKLGVEVVLEPGGKYFPSTHSGRTVLEALLLGVRESGVELIPARKVTRVIFENDSFCVEGDSFFYHAKNVILTTGGLSYPQTGSDGTGYQIAESFGHSRVPTSPALTPLLTEDLDFKKLSGISLPVRLSLSLNGTKKAEYEGSFLFTHTGFSGPVVLNISRYWIRLQEKGRIEIFANFLPEFREEAFRKRLLAETQEHPSRLVKNFLVDFLPRALGEMFLEKMAVEESRVLNQWDREAREKCLRTLFRFPLPVSGAVGYSKAEVTAGGVDLREIHQHTLESKLRPGLFFAGEILDADGRIGGFNFQWAWASGFLAAQGVLKKRQSLKQD